MTKEELRILMGNNIRDEREKRGMSIDELAMVLELAPGYLGLIERGRRGATAYNLYKLVQVLNISCDALFKPDDNTAEFVKDKKSKDALRKKISGLVVGLTGREMLLIIKLIKGIREMYHYYNPDDYDDE